MADLKSSIFILSGKRELFSKIILIDSLIFVQLGLARLYSRLSPTAAYDLIIFANLFSACTVAHLFERSGNNYRVAYFFCQFDNAESLSASVILSALVRQLLDIKTLPESIENSLVNVLKSSCPEAQDMGILLKDVLVITKCSTIIIDAIDECSISEWEVLLKVLQDIVVSYSGVVKIFLAVCQGIAKDVGKIFKSHYQVTIGSSKADSDIQTYIKDVLAEKRYGEKLVVGNPELINKITDADSASKWDVSMSY